MNMGEESGFTQKLKEENEMELFGKYCPICGMKVQKNESLSRFGQYFCSQEHMNKYVEQVQKQRLESPSEQHSRGGCC